MSNIAHLHEVLGVNDSNEKSSVHQYGWLLSEHGEFTWHVRDPGNSLSPISTNIHFDGPLIGGGRLADIDGLIDDLKLSLVLAVELSIFKGQSKIRSCSSMRQHVYALKRVFNEIYDMQGCCWERWTNADSEKLADRLKYKASISQSYQSRLVDYVERTGLSNIPISTYKGISKINYGAVFNAIGVDYYHLRDDDKVQNYLDEVCVQYNKQSSLIQLKRGERKSTPNSRTTLSRDRYEDILRAAILYQEQTLFIPKGFVNAKGLNVIGELSSLLGESAIKPSDPSRTRNIPVPIFLQLVDASIRYILEYSDLLFKVNTQLYQEHKRLTMEVGSYEAGKIVNGMARNLGKLKEGKYTPFPLAAYKHFQVRDKSVSDADLNEFCDLVNAGIARANIQARMGLSRGQYDYRLKLIRGVRPYSREIAHTGVSLQKALFQFLPLCCLIIIFAFSARRESEVFGMRAGCYKKFQDGWRIKFYVAKSRRRHEWFTSVPVVIKAIQTLEALSLHGRKISKSDSLFRFDDTFNRAPTNLDRLSSSISSFLEFIGADRENEFEFSEHQFRRFFAIMYFYRYEKQADLEALTYELRHEDWSNTAVYLTEQETGRIFREVEKEFMSEKLLSTLSDASNPQGVLAELDDKIKRAVDVVPMNREKIAMKYIDDNSLRMDFISEGLCFGNTPGRSKLSRCYDDGFVMCHRSSEEMCGGCPNLLPIENIKNDRKVAAMQSPECDSFSILEAAIKLSNGDRKVEG